MKKLKAAVVATVIGFTMVSLQGCSPEVGSKEWCSELKEKPKGDWTANEAKEYAKSCIL